MWSSKEHKHKQIFVNGLGFQANSNCMQGVVLWQFLPHGQSLAGVVLSLTLPSIRPSKSLSFTWNYGCDIRPSTSYPGQYSETICDNCFIFTGQINLTCRLCPVRLYWPFDLQSWKYDLHWKYCLVHCLEISNGNWFILLGHITLPWDLCTAELIWPVDLWPWHYDH